MAEGTRCKLPIYSASINPQTHERLSREQYLGAADIVERKLGFVGQPRAIVIQIHEGREHAHVIWSRIDVDTMTAISDSHNFRKHEYAARDIERRFGLDRVQGAHAERDNAPRPQRSPEHYELQQARRTGLSRDAASRFLTTVWRTTDNGHAFKAAIEDKGWLLARGDRRDFVLIDPHAGIHTPARRIEGARTAEIRDRFKDLDRGQLPTVADGRAIMRGRIATAEREAAVARNRPPDELARLHWDRITEDRIAAAGILYARAAEDIDKKRQRRAARDDGDGDMVSEQRAAHERFVRNSAALQAKHTPEASPTPEQGRQLDAGTSRARWGDQFKTTAQERESVENSIQQSGGRGRSR